MTHGQSQRIAELEVTVSSLEQRERYLHAVLSSAWTSRENRSDAREELESLLDKSDEAEHELTSLQTPRGVVEHRQEPSGNRVNLCRQPRGLLRRRFSLAVKKSKAFTM